MPLETVKKIVLRNPEYWSYAGQKGRKASSSRDQQFVKMQFDYPDFIKALKVRSLF